jgi:hypothetical protein
MKQNTVTIEVDTKHLTRLEIDGRFVGWLDIWAGIVMLYSRGKWAVYNIGDEREKAAVNPIQ